MLQRCQVCEEVLIGRSKDKISDPLLQRELTNVFTSRSLQCLIVCLFSFHSSYVDSTPLPFVELFLLLFQITQDKRKAIDPPGGPSLVRIIRDLKIPNHSKIL